MNIKDRIGVLEDVNDVYWDNQRNRLVVYYSGLLDTIKIRVANAIAGAHLQEAIDEITLIRSEL